MKTKKKYVLAAILILVLLCFCLFVLQDQQRQRKTEITSGEALEEMQENYLHVSYDGKEYDYNSRITTVLYAGIDSGGELTTSNRYSTAPRANTICVVVLDDYHKYVKLLTISRDTLAAVDRYTMNGNYRDQYETQIGYAFTYGDGGKASCDNLAAAVSRILGGVPIHEYVVTNESCLEEINAMVGGVTVTVPNDDLVSLYPELTAGAIVTLDDSNVSDYLRYRDIGLPFSNVGRMERQEEFFGSFMERFMAGAAEDPEGVWTKIQALSPHMYTSIAKNQYLSLTSLLSGLEFSGDHIDQMTGQNVKNGQYDEVHLDQDGQIETILELFYLEEGTEAE